MMRQHQLPPKAAAFAAEEEEDEEEDFMSDKYILQAEEESKKAKSQISYSDRRRKELAESSAKARQKSRAQREEEARREGLERNLLEPAHDETNGGGTVLPGTQADSKAVKMMLAMGYQPGQELGSKATAPTIQGGEGGSQAVSGPSSAAQPIALDSRWQGKVRHGIGSSAVSLAIHRAAYDQRQKGIGPSSAQDLADFRSRVAAEQTQRHVEKLLDKARHTCEELDRKILQMEYSPLWIDVKWMDMDWETQLGDNAHDILKSAFGDEMEQRQAGDDGDGSKLAEQEAKVRKALEQTAPSMPEHPSEEPPNPKPPTGTVSDEEGEAETADAPLSSAQEARQFCSLEASTRLKLTLDHLRKVHHYCLFCGCQYEDEEDLAANCPGETEEEHD